jgi:hypothetical protein
MFTFMRSHGIGVRLCVLPPIRLWHIPEQNRGRARAHAAPTTPYVRTRVRRACSRILPNLLLRRTNRRRIRLQKE